LPWLAPSLEAGVASVEWSSPDGVWLHIEADHRCAEIDWAPVLDHLGVADDTDDRAAAQVQLQALADRRWGIIDVGRSCMPVITRFNACQALEHASKKLASAYGEAALKELRDAVAERAVERDRATGEDIPPSEAITQWHEVQRGVLRSLVYADNQDVGSFGSRVHHELAAPAGFRIDFFAAGILTGGDGEPRWLVTWCRNRAMSVPPRFSPVPDQQMIMDVGSQLHTRADRPWHVVGPAATAPVAERYAAVVNGLVALNAEEVLYLSNRLSYRTATRLRHVRAQRVKKLDEVDGVIAAIDAVRDEVDDARVAVSDLLPVMSGAAGGDIRDEAIYPATTVVSQATDQLQQLERDLDRIGGDAREGQTMLWQHGNHMAFMAELQKQRDKLTATATLIGGVIAVILAGVGVFASVAAIPTPQEVSGTELQPADPLLFRAAGAAGLAVLLSAGIAVLVTWLARRSDEPDDARRIRSRLGLAVACILLLAATALCAIMTIDPDRPLGLPGLFVLGGAAVAAIVGACLLAGSYEPGFVRDGRSVREEHDEVVVAS